MLKLKVAYLAECPNCFLHRTITAPSEEKALEALTVLGWSDVCIRCTELRKLNAKKPA